MTAAETAEACNEEAVSEYSYESSSSDEGKGTAAAGEKPKTPPEVTTPAAKHEPPVRARSETIEPPRRKSWRGQPQVQFTKEQLWKFYVDMLKWRKFETVDPTMASVEFAAAQAVWEAPGERTPAQVRALRESNSWKRNRQHQQLITTKAQYEERAERMMCIHKQSQRANAESEDEWMYRQNYNDVSARRFRPREWERAQEKLRDYFKNENADALGKKYPELLQIFRHRYEIGKGEIPSILRDKPTRKARARFDKMGENWRNHATIDIAHRAAKYVRQTDWTVFVLSQTAVTEDQGRRLALRANNKRGTSYPGMIPLEVKRVMETIVTPSQADIATSAANLQNDGTFQPAYDLQSQAKNVNDKPKKQNSLPLEPRKETFENVWKMSENDRIHTVLERLIYYLRIGNGESFDRGLPGHQGLETKRDIIHNLCKGNEHGPLWIEHRGQITS